MKVELVSYPRARIKIESVFVGSELDCQKFLHKRLLGLGYSSVCAVYDDAYINEPLFTKFYHHHVKTKVRINSFVR